ncbi:MAG TPA: response regulator transcription factor [Thermoanaerobaculia bacterium]|nr:response regulator transcription factor [Thermoanaerobaculia bacterium]
MILRGRVLVVDDDPAIRRSIVAELRGEGYETVEAADGREAMSVAARSRPDLVLVDLAMPAMDGFAFITSFRKSVRTPIVVLSVRGGEADRVRALDLGADDFMAKPFSVAELLARIRAHLRRSGVDARPSLRFPGMRIDFERRRVTEGEREIRLTPTEFSLLWLLASNAGKVVTTDQIIGRVWKDAPATTADTVRVHMASLRKKVEPEPSTPQFIVTEPWVGYRFIAEPIEDQSPALEGPRA